MLDVLRSYITRAEEVIDKDDTYWEELQTGQSTEEAEDSGFYAGQAAGLRAAELILRGRYADADRELQLAPLHLANTEATS